MLGLREVEVCHSGVRVQGPSGSGWAPGTRARSLPYSAVPSPLMGFPPRSPRAQPPPHSPSSGKAQAHGLRVAYLLRNGLKVLPRCHRHDGAMWGLPQQRDAEEQGLGEAWGL